MRLDGFVKLALIEVTNGVAQAQQEVLLNIAPGYVEGQEFVEKQMVSFESSVVVNKEGDRGVSVFSFGELNAKAATEHSNKNCFEGPVCLNVPTSKNPNLYTHQDSINQIGEISK